MRLFAVVSICLFRRQRISHFPKWSSPRRLGGARKYNRGGKQKVASLSAAATQKKQKQSNKQRRKTKRIQFESGFSCWRSRGSSAAAGACGAWAPEIERRSKRRRGEGDRCERKRDYLTRREGINKLSPMSKARRTQIKILFPPSIAPNIKSHLNLITVAAEENDEVGTGCRATEYIIISESLFSPFRAPDVAQPASLRITVC